MSALFIQITPETSLYCVASNLTKMQYRLWLFLYHLDPFGDRPVLIPTPVELAAQLNMSVRSIYRALQKLSELGLFTIASNYSRSITNGIKNQPLGTKKLRDRSFKSGVRSQESGVNSTEIVQQSKTVDTSNKSKTANLAEKNKSKTKKLLPVRVPLRQKPTRGRTVPDSLTPDSERGCAKNVTVVPEMSSTLPKLSQPCQNWQNQPPQASDDNGFTHPQTNTDNRKTLSDIEGSENINSIANNQELVDFWFEENTCNSSSSAVPIKNEGSIAPNIEQLNENDNSNIPAELLDNDRLKDNDSTTNSIALSNWLPLGPWSIEGKLDPNFRDWLAKDWISRYGGTIHQRRADVLSHFQNKPAMLPVRWEQYRSEYLDRFTNAQTRMTNGMSIDPTEQEQLLEHTNAVTNPLPADMSPVADKKRSPSVEGDRADLIEIKALKAEETEKASSSVKDRALHNPSNPQEEEATRHEEDRCPANAENPEAYKLLQPKAIDPLAGLELLKEAFTMKKPLAKPKTKLSENPLTKLNDWLKDDILYLEAIARAKNNGYSIEYNENSRAIAIYELDF